MFNNGAIISTRTKRTRRSVIIAIRRIIQTGKLVRILNTDIKVPATVNSNIKIGKTGGTIGGIPVISQDIDGDKTANMITNRQLRNMLPTIIGINIGKNAGPKPRKWNNCGKIIAKAENSAARGICLKSF